MVVFGQEWLQAQQLHMLLTMEYTVCSCQPCSHAWLTATMTINMNMICFVLYAVYPTICHLMVLCMATEIFDHGCIWSRMTSSSTTTHVVDHGIDWV